MIDSASVVLVLGVFSVQVILRVITLKVDDPDFETGVMAFALLFSIPMTISLFIVGLLSENSLNATVIVGLLLMSLLPLLGRFKKVFKWLSVEFSLLFLMVAASLLIGGVLAMSRLEAAAIIAIILLSAQLLRISFSMSYGVLTEYILLFFMGCSVVTNVVALMRLSPTTLLAVSVGLWLVVETWLQLRYNRGPLRDIKARYQRLLTAADELQAAAEGYQLAPVMGMAWSRLPDAEPSTPVLLVDFRDYLPAMDSEITDVAWRITVLSTGGGYDARNVLPYVCLLLTFRANGTPCVLPIHIGTETTDQKTKETYFRSMWIFNAVLTTPTIHLQQYDPSIKAHYKRGSLNNDKSFYEHYIAPAESISIDLPPLPIEALRTRFVWDKSGNKWQRNINTFLDGEPLTPPDRVSIKVDLPSPGQMPLIQDFACRLRDGEHPKLRDLPRANKRPLLFIGLPSALTDYTL